MSKVPKKVVNWLYTVIQPQYVHKNIVYTDTIRFLDLYLSRGFKIRTSVFVSSNGASELLLCASGSLECTGGPVPITIWIPLNYPFTEADSLRTEANGVPLVFVNPPQESAICPGNNVDAQGRFYHPYLSQWYSAERNPSFSSEFNLLRLINYLQNTFNREFPMREKLSGPSIPPKTSMVEPSPQDGPRRETNGPPLPVKPETPSQGDNSVPARYRSPPPLPNQHVQPSPRNLISGRHNISAVDSNESLQVRHHQQDEMVKKQKESKNSKVSSTKPKASKANIEDLMDQMTLDSGKELLNESGLKLLSDQIETVLNGDQPDNINQIIRHVSRILKDMEPLAEHLDHHNIQAKANSDNLEKHIVYLKERLEALKTLNGDLLLLKDLNQSTVEEVHLDRENSIKMDDIIIPDSALVSQLYETISDIKAGKDCIRLIEGGYQNEPELINDDTLDTCVKSVRAISRDLFWLEVTKNQITQKMGLEC